VKYERNDGHDRILAYEPILESDNPLYLLLIGQGKALASFLCRTGRAKYAFLFAG
jgi:hypothetical protein